MIRVHRRLFSLILALFACFVLALASMVVSGPVVMYLTLAALGLSFVLGAWYLNAFRHQMYYLQAFRCKPPSAEVERVSQEELVLGTLKRLCREWVEMRRVATVCQAKVRWQGSLLQRSIKQDEDQAWRSFCAAFRAALFFGYRLPSVPTEIVYCDSITATGNPAV